MLKLNSSGKFKKDLEKCVKRGWDITLLQNVIDILRVPAELPIKNRDHPLKGNYAGKRECHVLPDWLLVYEIGDEELYLDRTGTHSDLFKN